MISVNNLNERISKVDHKILRKVYSEANRRGNPNNPIPSLELPSKDDKTGEREFRCGQCCIDFIAASCIK